MNMKKFILYAILIAMSGCSFWSCSSDSTESDPLVGEELQAFNDPDEEKAAELILYMNEIAPQFPSYAEITDTKSLRGFFKWLGNVIKCDAFGYVWGLVRGAGFQGSIVPAVACSIVGAIKLSDDNGMTIKNWTLNPNWNSITAAFDFQKIGYDHNKCIYNMYQKNPQLFSKSNSAIISLSESTLKGMGYSSSLQSIEYNYLLSTLDISYSQFESNIVNALRTSAYSSIVSVINEYADNVINFNDVSQINTYTNMIYDRIDMMGFSKSKELKAAIAICGNSRILWQEKN